MPSKNSEALVLTSKQNGIVVIPMGTELTRLNYFDGKFLRASDLKAEQDYLRHLVQESNRAGGSGVAQGFDVTLGAGDKLNIGPGLAIDPDGRVLLMPQGTSIGIQDLIDKSRELEKLLGNSAETGGSFAECEEVSSAPPVNVTNPDNIYKIVICAAEALCGEENVYGKLCEEACSTSTDRPFVIEGVVIRAIPLGVAPTTKGQLTQMNLRSRTAAAYFEFERNRVSNLISANGLKQPIWCLGANAEPDGCVPIGVIARSGSSTVFLDPWIVRRELIDTPARRYWQWRMMMRPWDVFLAHILQFQCQLRDLYKNFPDPGTGPGPCGDATDALNEAALAIAELHKYYEATAAQLAQFNAKFDPFTGGGDRLLKLNQKLDSVYKNLSTVPADRWLINGGIIELPSAGYLPVVPSANITINKQVRQMMGEGVDLRFCIVRPDYVAHALEEAQHMERISLIAGLEDATQKPKVDILVPNGEIIEQKAPSQNLFEATVKLMSTSFDSTQLNQSTSQPKLVVEGAARPETLPTGGGAFHLAIGGTQSARDLFNEPSVTAAEPAKKASAKATASEEKAGAGMFARFAKFATADAQAKAAKTASTAKQEATNLASADQNPSVSGGIWLTMKCERDVFKLAVNETTTISASGTFGMIYQGKTLFLEGTIIGEFRVTAAAASSSGKVVGSFVGSASATIKSPDSNDTKDVSAPVPKIKLSIESGQSSKPQGRLVRIIPDLPNTKTTAELTVDWGGTPLEINCAVNVQAADGKKTTVLTVDFRSNEAVAQVGNKFHKEATDALDLIGDVIDDDGFAARSGKILFPPAPPAGDELIIKGILDWVLFHRRRDKECKNVVIPPPPPPPPLRYGFWMGVAANSDAAQAAAKALAEGKPFDVEGIFFQRVDTIEFEAGRATLISSSQDVAADWKKVNPGEQIVHAAIASATVKDSEAVGNGRLTRLEQAVALTSDASNATSQVLGTVHPELPAPGTDGIVVFITLRKETGPACRLDAKTMVFAATPGGKSTLPLTINNDSGTDFNVTLGTTNPRFVVISPKPPTGVNVPAGKSLQVTLEYSRPAGVPPTEDKDTLSISTQPTADLCPSVALVGQQITPPATVRIARLLVQTDTNSVGTRFFATTLPPVITVQFNPDGSLQTQLTAAVAAEFRKHFPNLVGLIEMGPAQAGADPLEAKRLDAFVAELDAKKLLGPGAKSQVVALQPAEQTQLDLGGGVKATDLIFMSF